MFGLGLGLRPENAGFGLGLETSGLGLGLEATGLGLVPPGLVNITGVYSAASVLESLHVQAKYRTESTIKNQHIRLDA